MTPNRTIEEQAQRGGDKDRRTISIAALIQAPDPEIDGGLEIFAEKSQGLALSFDRKLPSSDSYSKVMYSTEIKGAHNGFVLPRVN